MRILSDSRDRLRAGFFRFLDHVLSLPDTRSLVSQALRSQQLLPFRTQDLGIRMVPPPYPGIGRAGNAQTVCNRDDIVFVTGRFRSGSTLIWSLFRATHGVTAYYEPFNERRWFDARTRGDWIDETHINVDDYWSEYDGLAELDRYFRKDWTFRELYMGADAWNPDLQRYIEILIAKAPGRPVLQENRIDFRLPWLRARFPHCRIVHIVRNPREQWLSALGKRKRAPRDLRLAEFRVWDRFYLLPWGRELATCFPFLTQDPDAHPYELFYQIWLLSYLFGTSHSDVSIRYEDLLEEPVTAIRRLFDALAMECDPAALATKVVRRPGDRWKEYADQGWFADIEARVDDTLSAFMFAATAPPDRPRP